jgi:uncharacterized membrane protein HdeD (DUF308 family)
MTSATAPQGVPRDASRGRRAATTKSGPPWWLFLVTGACWMIISLVVLRFDTRSIATIGLLAGLVFIAAGVNEFLAAAAGAGWTWLHIIMGALLIVAGVIALFSPGDTFWFLAAIIGWYLLFSGTLHIVGAFAAKEADDLWWLTLVVGILEIMMAFWATGGYGHRIFLLIVWVGFAAMARGVTEIVTAFQLRGLES